MLMRLLPLANLRKPPEIGQTSVRLPGLLQQVDRAVRFDAVETKSAALTGKRRSVPSVEGRDRRDEIIRLCSGKRNVVFESVRRWICIFDRNCQLRRLLK